MQNESCQVTIATGEASRPRQTLQTRLLIFAAAALFLFSASSPAQTNRVVILKVDGLPYDIWWIVSHTNKIPSPEKPAALV